MTELISSQRPPHFYKPTITGAIWGAPVPLKTSQPAEHLGYARTKEEKFPPEHDSVMNVSYTEIKLFRPKDAQTERDKNCDHTNKTLLTYLGSGFSIELPSQREAMKGKIFNTYLSQGASSYNSLE